MQMAPIISTVPMEPTHLLLERQLPLMRQVWTSMTIPESSTILVSCELSAPVDAQPGQVEPGWALYETEDI